MHEHINRLLADFGDALGLDRLSLDEKGYCCLGFDDWLVNIEAVADSALVLLYTSVGVLPADAAPEIYRSLLDANYFFQGTAGATVGLDLAAGTVALTRVVDTAGMQVLDWEGVLAGFVDAAESCARRLQQPAGAALRDAGWEPWPAHAQENRP